MKKIIVVCGPTASGKTDFAHYLAKKNRGEIVNGDSMQIYRQIPIITASPSPALKEEIPYHLYNFLDIEQEFSVTKYVQLAVKIIKEINNRGNLPIIVGGTGMYINALLYGYSQIPTISPQIRSITRELQDEIGQVEFFKRLTILDPLAKNNLNIFDKQRCLRAYEVVMQTGKSIFTFQATKDFIPLPEYASNVFFLYPERSFLYLSCNNRLKAIFKQGAIEEISRIQRNNANNIPTSALRAIGVQEIMAYLDKKTTLDRAMECSQNKTRQYAKRQITWFKNQIKDKLTLEYSSYEEFKKLIENFIL